MKKNEVAVQETKALVVAAPEAVVSETLLTSDMIIPRVLLQQALSEAVSERKCMAGDIIRSTTKEVLGNDRAEPIKFIPITYKTTWILNEEINGKYEYRGVEPRTAQNENSDWEFFKDGGKWKRVKGVDVYALLSKDVDADIINTSLSGDEIPDVDKVLLPVVIGFRSTSYQAGKAVINHFMKIKTLQAKLPHIAPFMYEMSLACKCEKNDKGTFFIYDVPASSNKAKPEYIAAAREWHKVISSQAIVVDEEVSPVKENASSKHDIHSEDIPF